VKWITSRNQFEGLQAKVIVGNSPNMSIGEMNHFPQPILGSAGKGDCGQFFQCVLRWSVHGKGGKPASQQASRPTN